MEMRVINKGNFVMVLLFSFPTFYCHGPLLLSLFFFLVDVGSIPSLGFVQNCK